MTIPSDFALGVEAHVLLWIVARRRSDGQPEGTGIWTGADIRQFSIDGEVRTYLGSGLVLGVEPVKAGIGGEVVVHRITLPPLRDEVRDLTATYDLHQARVELHSVALRDHDVAWSARWIKGVLDRRPGGLTLEGGHVTLEVVSNARRGTFGLPLYRSDEQHRRVWPNDKFREWVVPTAERRVPWGQ